MGDYLYFGEDGPTHSIPLPPSSCREVSLHRKPRVVIIEDEFLVAWNLQQLLHDRNFDFCEIASDADGAVDLAVRQEAELLLVDVNLGEGPDEVEAVRQSANIKKLSQFS